MKIDCQYFDGSDTKEGCCAPVCPLMPESLENGIWYAEEGVCKRQDFGKRPWVKAQKRLARMNARPEGYFTLAMLRQGCVLRRGIQGLDPDKPEETQLSKWIKAHPRKREISEEERAELRERIKRIPGMQKWGSGSQK